VASVTYHTQVLFRTFTTRLSPASQCLEKKRLDTYVICVTPYGMDIAGENKPPWLLFVFSLPAKRASQRVEIWRLLKRYGSVGLGSSGEASVIHVESIDNFPSKELSELFLEARGGDYDAMIRELKHYKGGSKPGQLSRLRRRFQELAAIDFFNSPLRSRGEQLLASADAQQDTGVVGGATPVASKERISKADLDDSSPARHR
jgi:hypothetical protein